MIKKYLLNIQTKKIHNGFSPCHRAKSMKESNKKWFDNYEEAVNFYEGKSRGEPCGICLKDYEND